jgi:hypothetical protein
MKNGGIIEWRKLKTKQVHPEVALYMCNANLLGGIPTNAPDTIIEFFF